MRVKSIALENFGSYDSLELSIENSGLVLFYGPTGSGKSTVMDGVCWTLFGVTAKDGNVDDVRSWKNPKDPTLGIATVDTPTGEITVGRKRGQPSENDLYWIEADSEVLVRGKDLNETQRLLNNRLGVDQYLYLSGAYFSDFSPSGTFFVAKAKERRSIFERIAPLAVPAKLADKSAGLKKDTKSSITKLSLEIAAVQGELKTAAKSLDYAAQYVDQWERSQEALLKELQVKFTDFEKFKRSAIDAAQTFYDRAEKDKTSQVDKFKLELSNLSAKIKSDTYFEESNQLLSEELEKHDAVCEACGGPVSSPERESIVAALADLGKAEYENKRNQDLKAFYLEKMSTLIKAPNAYADKLQSAKNQENKYDDQLKVESKKQNPYVVQCGNAKKEVIALEEKCAGLTKRLEATAARLSSLDQVYDLSFTLRGVLLTEAVKSVEGATNGYLDRFFDSELRVTFAVKGADELDVQIFKSGYECNFRQLSKGQRQLLKLSFAVSIMKATANSAGVHFSNLFFDEALDGLDMSLKLKAFELFNELSTQHESVYVIDHAQEVQALFPTRMRVEMESDTSRIVEDEG